MPSRPTFPTLKLNLQSMEAKNPGIFPVGQPLLLTRFDFKAGKVGRDSRRRVQSTPNGADLNVLRTIAQQLAVLGAQVATIPRVNEWPIAA